MNFFLQEFLKGVKGVKGVKELRSYRSLRSLRSEDKCLGGNIICFNFRKLAPHAQKGRA